MKKLTYDDAFEIASESFRLLAIYFNVTRPMNTQAYFKNGKFDIGEYVQQMKFLSHWKELPSTQKKALAKTYSNYNTTFNYVQGMPIGLVKRLCKVWYYDGSGKRCQTKCSDIIQNAVEKGLVVCIHGGSKFAKDSDGNYKKKCWWNNKYVFTDKKFQYGLMNCKAYGDIATYPHTQDLTSNKYIAFLKTRDAIFNFYRKTDVVKEDVKPVKSQESAISRFARKYAQNFIRGLVGVTEVENELRACRRTQKEIDLVLDVLQKLKRQTAKGKLSDRSKEYFTHKENYLNGSLPFDEFRSWMVANGIDKGLIKQWDDHELVRLNQVCQEREVNEPALKLSNREIDELIMGM